jgi:U3 small nucleolar RNA-associated protein 19
MLSISRERNSSFWPLFPRHLPAALLASFVKRLSRLSLTAPPSSIVMTIPFVYNILKRHPALMCMIHRDGQVPEPHEGELVFPRIHNFVVRSLCRSICGRRTQPKLDECPGFFTLGIVLAQQSLPRSGVDTGTYIRGGFHQAELSYGGLFGPHIRYGASTDS